MRDADTSIALHRRAAVSVGTGLVAQRDRTDQAFLVQGRAWWVCTPILAAES